MIRPLVRSIRIFVRQQLRTFTSVNVAAVECLMFIISAVLIGVGATTVNAYVAEAALAERHERGLLAGLQPRLDAVQNFVKAVEEGLLKIMSKMAFRSLASYRGGYNLRRLACHGRFAVAKFFPPMSSRISGLGLKGIAFSRIITMHDKAFPVIWCIYRLAVFPFPQIWRAARLDGADDPCDAARLRYWLVRAGRNILLWSMGRAN